MKNLIRKILKEETEKNKINSVVELIKTLFDDVVVNIEVSELYGKPYINVDIKTDDPAANIETWYCHKIKEKVLEYTGDEFILQPFWSADRLRGKNADAFIDVNKKHYDNEEKPINESNIKKHPREEDLKKYDFLIDDIIYKAVSEDQICGYNKEFFLNAGEEALRIVLYYKKEYRPTYENHRAIVLDIVSMIENYLPIVDKTFVSSDSTKCKDEINESANIIEVPYKEVENYKDIIETIVYEVLGDKICGFRIEPFQFYDEMCIRIVPYYKSGNYNIDLMVENHKDLANILKTYVPIVERYFVSYDTTKCEYEINESVNEVEKNLSAIREILKTITFDGLCDIWVEHNPEDGEYEIRSKKTVSYYNSHEYYQEFEYLENIIKSFGVRPYIFAPYYVENCDDEVEFLN